MKRLNTITTFNSGVKLIFLNISVGYYWLMAHKKYLLFASQNYAYAILRPLQEAIRARGDDVYWYLSGKSINRGYLKNDEVALNSIEAVVTFGPDAVFVPGNVVPDYIPGLKVAVFHGFNVEKRTSSRGHFNIRGCFDLYCTQGPNTTEPFKVLSQKYHYFLVKETGWPAIDPLFDYSEPTKAKPTILLCSTFSSRLSCAEHLFDTIKELSASGKWQWLVQFHPKMAQSTVEKYKSIQNEHLTFIETDNVIPLLQTADVMVCDTSSVVTMFQLLRKPVVTFKNASPKDYMIDIDNVDLLEKSIEKALEKPNSLMKAIDHFIEDTHPYKDGQSSERVLCAVDELLNGLISPKKRKPLNLWRNLKSRKENGYWRLLR